MSSVVKIVSTDAVKLEMANPVLVAAVAVPSAAEAASAARAVVVVRVGGTPHAAAAENPSDGLIIIARHKPTGRSSMRATVILLVWVVVVVR